MDLSKATVEELCTLQQIGKTTANRIIEYREQVGGPLTIEGLAEATGKSQDFFPQVDRGRETLKFYWGNT